MNLEKCNQFRSKYVKIGKAHRAEGCGEDRGMTLVRKRWLASGKTTYHQLNCQLVRASLVNYLSGRWRQEGGQKGKQKNIFKMPELRQKIETISISQKADPWRLSVNFDPF